MRLWFVIRLLDKNNILRGHRFHAESFDFAEKWTKTFIESFGYELVSLECEMCPGFNMAEEMAS